MPDLVRHCEARSAAAIHRGAARRAAMDCFAALAMTASGVVGNVSHHPRISVLRAAGLNIAHCRRSNNLAWDTQIIPQ
jgi:hypothetical protein